MKRTRYPNVTIVRFPIPKYPYSVFLKTKGGRKIIVNGIQTIEQAQEIAQQWADELQIPICLHEIT